MVIRFLRWLGKNLSALLLAFILAMVVWVSASISNDPNQEQWLSRGVRVELVGKDPGLQVMSTVPDTVRIRLSAPSTRWTSLLSDTRSVRAWVNLAGLQEGQHDLPVQIEVKDEIRPVRVISVDPDTIEVTLEPVVVEPISITLMIDGEPALGYQADRPNFSPETVVVSGPQSLAEQVQKVQGYLNIAGSRQSVETTIQLTALDRAGNPVSGVTLTPDSIDVTLPVNLQGGYRNVIVKVNVVGYVADGYKLTNITVSPPTVTVFSSDPTLVNELPGYVEAEELDISGASDDIETYLDLQLPKGISVVNDQKVLVQVSVAAIESNVNFTLPVEVIGADPRFMAIVAPASVDVILSGPVPVLKDLLPSNLRLVIDVGGLTPGTYQLTPTISFLPQRVRVESIVPASIQVTITVAPTPTPTSSPTPTPTITPTPMP